MKTGEEIIKNQQEEAKKSVLSQVDFIIGNGCKLICEERLDQMYKHGWSLENDSDYSGEELLKAAMFCIDQKRFEWPRYWDDNYRNKIINKHRIDQLKVAGAFIAAEIDRLQNNKYQQHYE